MREASNGRWEARISVSGKIRKLGLFDTPDEAAKRFDAEAVALGRPAANFPVGGSGSGSGSGGGSGGGGGDDALSASRKSHKKKAAPEDGGGVGGVGGSGAPEFGLDGSAIVGGGRKRKEVERFAPTMRPDLELAKERSSGQASSSSSSSSGSASGSAAAAGGHPSGGQPGDPYEPRGDGEGVGPHAPLGLNKHGKPKQPNQYTKQRERDAASHSDPLAAGGSHRQAHLRGSLVAADASALVAAQQGGAHAFQLPGPGDRSQRSESAQSGGSGCGFEGPPDALLGSLVRPSRSAAKAANAKIMRRENPEAAARAEINTFGLSEAETKTIVIPLNPGGMASHASLGRTTSSTSVSLAAAGDGSSLEASATKDEDKWACCESCEKWRRLPSHVDVDALPEKWYCRMNHWDPQRNHCGAEQEDDTASSAAADAGCEHQSSGGAPKPKQPNQYTIRRERLEWVQCDECNRWRRIPESAIPPGKDMWFCRMNRWDKKYDHCGAPEEAVAEDDDGTVATSTAQLLGLAGSAPMSGGGHTSSGGGGTSHSASQGGSPRAGGGGGGSQGTKSGGGGGGGGGGGSGSTALGSLKVGAGGGHKEVCEWVQCDRKSCSKWRKLPPKINPDSLPAKWVCADNWWDSLFADCSAPEEVEKADDDLRAIG